MGDLVNSSAEVEPPLLDFGVVPYTSGSRASDVEWAEPLSGASPDQACVERCSALSHELTALANFAMRRSGYVPASTADGPSILAEVLVEPRNATEIAATTGIPRFQVEERMFVLQSMGLVRATVGRFGASRPAYVYVGAPTQE